MSAADFYDRDAAKFRDSYNRSRDFGTRFALWTRLIDSYGTDAGTCLDLGCGPGLFSLYAAERGLETVGIDPSPQMLAMCDAESQRRRLGNVRFLQSALPLPDALSIPSADLILCSSVLEYVADLERAVAGIVDRLNPGGHFIVSLPNAQSVYRSYEKLRYRLTGKPEYYRHVHHVFSARAAVRYFARFGLVCRDCQFYGDEPLISRLVSRCLPERFSKNLFVLVLARNEAKAVISLSA